MNQMGNLEKLGILVIVILVVVVGVVAITPKEQVDSALFPEDTKGDTAAQAIDPVAEGSATTDPTQWPLPSADLGVGSKSGASLPPVQTPGADGQLPAAVPPTPVEPQFTEYVVQKGDTPERIARKLLGSGQAWTKIAEANPGLDARHLKINQKLRIPAATAKVPATPVTGAGAATAGASTSVPPLSPPLGVEAPALPPAVVVPAPTPAPTPAPAPVAAEKVYVVQPGDTLSDIARREIGSSSKWRLIVEANPDVLHGSEVVRSGMKLRIPASVAKSSSAAAPATVAAKEKSVPASAGSKTYTVQSGDTLSSIASRMLGSSGRWREILAANESVLHGSDKLRAGMVLSVPETVSAR